MHPRELGRVLTDGDDEGAVRVLVVRNFKGSAKGDIPVTVYPAGLPGLSDYELGESYSHEASEPVVLHLNGPDCIHESPR